MDDPAAFSLEVFPAIRNAKETMIILALSSARCIGLVHVMPLFKRTELGRLVLGTIAISFALPIIGGLGPTIQAQPTDDLLQLIFLLFKEYAIGALLGVLFGMPFWAIQAVGEFVDHQRSIGESGLEDPATGGQASVMAVLLNLVAITLFAVEGGLSLMVETIYQSYDIWGIPVFFPTITAGAFIEVTSILGQIVLFGLLVAAPLIFVFLLSDFSVMALGRTTSQIELASILPLIKNIIFVVFSIVYIEFLVGYMRQGLGQTQIISNTLEAFVGR